MYATSGLKHRSFHPSEWKFLPRVPCRNSASVETHIPLAAPTAFFLQYIFIFPSVSTHLTREKLRTNEFLWNSPPFTAFGPFLSFSRSKMAFLRDFARFGNRRKRRKFTRSTRAFRARRRRVKQGTSRKRVGNIRVGRLEESCPLLLVTWVTVSRNASTSWLCSENIKLSGL